MKIKLAMAGAALAAVTLTGCGGGNDAYCSDLEDAKTEFEALSEGDAAQFDQTFSTLQGLADSAPDELSEEWAQLDESISRVQEALDNAGVTFDDLANAQSGELPEGVEPEDLQDLVAEFQEIGSQETQDASDAIVEHAKEECDVDLSS
ncbi:hypothetical protein [Aeromicrobium sp. CTD01-1L150]|uniref:hypothetical protein n=1 Tax=Aeromicrobium sp. CTD01-1L150 TaxID=3341830 RepID=UPI0035C1AB46